MRWTQVLCVVGVVAAAVVWSTLQAQDRTFPRTALPAGGLITHTTETPTAQQLTVIDPATRSMAVYHVEKASGRLTLKSVRRFQWDLQLEEFNGASPLPREIQSMLHR